QTLGGALQGGSRFAAHIELSIRSDSPSASAVTARDLIVSAGAARAARMSLADPALSLESIAGSLSPGMTAALVHDMAQRAQWLLLTQSGSGLVAQRAASFRTWMNRDVADATAGITVSPLAVEAKRLWDAIASTESLSTALNDYLSSFDESNPAPEAILQLCEQLQAGLDNPETLFRRFLFGEDFDSRLAAFDALGSAGGVFQRAVALSICSRLEGNAEGRQLAGFLLERTGIANSADAPALAGATFDLESAAFAGGGDLA